MFSKPQTRARGLVLVPAEGTPALSVVAAE